MGAATLILAAGCFCEHLPVSPAIIFPWTPSLSRTVHFL